MLLKVVIVEDEEIIRKGLYFVVDWLEMGCVIAGMAKDGQEGLELIKRERPDVVLADIRMPRLSGLKMIELALAEYSFHSIVLTSYSEFELARQALHIGVTEYLLKPIDEEELAEAIIRIKEQVEQKEKFRKVEQLTKSHTVHADCGFLILEQAGHDMDLYVQKTYEFIKSRYMEKISINTVAEELGVSASYLSRKLKKSLNATFVDLLNQYRVKQAISLLSKGTLRIYEISDQLGFSEYKHFCSVFKKYTQVTPSEFVKNGSILIQEEK